MQATQIQGLRRTAPLGGVCVLAACGLVGSVLFAEQAQAQRWDPYGFYAPDYPRYHVMPRRSLRERPRRPDPRTRGASPSQASQLDKKDPPPPPGPHLLIVSVKSQRISLYANGKLAAQSPVSTGTATHPTPHGVFSIIQRNRHHRSNIYSDAPMPYMQRLTWSGIALHQGALPGRPASHGCIRLPEQFASFLWRTTKLNTRVVIAREDVEPSEIAHPNLFQPKPVATTVENAPALRKTLDTASSAPVQFAAMQPVTLPAQNEPAAPAETAPAETASAPQMADIPEPILTSFVQSLQAKQKHTPPTGPISVFISRKEKRLYVRQGFIPLFTAPVSFREDAPLGTHVFSALKNESSENTLRWIVITLPTDAPREKLKPPDIYFDARGRRIETSADPIAMAALPPPPSAASVLDRIEIAPEVADRISEYVGAGASLIVSDHGLGSETGLYTDFIVVTR